MKPILLVLIAAFILAPAFAVAQPFPVDRGNVIVGGSADLTSRSTPGLDGDERSTTFSISPDVEFFVIPNLAVGGTASFLFSSFNGESDAAMVLGPTLSYFFGGPGRTLYPFVSGSVQFNVEEFNDSASLLLEGGGAYMVARNVALTGTLFYNGLLDDLGGQNVFGLRFGVKAFVF